VYWRNPLFSSAWSRPKEGRAPVLIEHFRQAFGLLDSISSVVFVSSLVCQSSETEKESFPSKSVTGNSSAQAKPKKPI
jgi:hypothetical protein